MLEKSALEDEKIITCLRQSYGLAVASLQFLPIGNDATAWVYKVQTDEAKSYFLKVKKGSAYEPSLLVPRYLKDRGIEQVVAPLLTPTQELWQSLDSFTLILYPFIEGHPGMETGLSDQQWSEFGVIMKAIHTTALSPELAEQVKKETFIPKWAGLVKQLQTQIKERLYDDSPQKVLALFWQERSEEISQIVARTEELGRLLQQRSLDFVLCHADIHTANILLDQEHNLFIVDWDETVLAPKERDLMFVVGDQEEVLFFKGYGKTEIDALALAYYRYEWAVQEIGDFGERVFLSQDLGEETKKEAVQGFVELFQPGDVVEGAYASDVRNR
jgi:spectinomycin phosphotransferase